MTIFLDIFRIKFSKFSISIILKASWNLIFGVPFIDWFCMVFWSFYTIKTLQFFIFFRFLWFFWFLWFLWFLWFFWFLIIKPSSSTDSIVDTFTCSSTPNLVPPCINNIIRDLSIEVYEFGRLTGLFFFSDSVTFILITETCLPLESSSNIGF